MRSFPAITLVAGLLAGLSLAAIPAVRDVLPFGAPKPPPAEPAPSPGQAHSHADAHAEAHAHAEAIVHMTPAQMKEQAIAVAVAGPGDLARRLTAFGAVSAAADRIARVPARVVGTVAEMRRRPGDEVRAGEVVAVLDSREVADAKGEYLTALVNADLQRTNFERALALRQKGVASESQYLQVQAASAETELRLDLARQKLSALGLDAQAVADAARADRQTMTSSLRQYELRAPIGGKIIDRRVDVGTAVGKEGDPSDLYTIADLRIVWVELAVSTADLDAVAVGAPVRVSTATDESRVKTGRIIFVSPVLNPDTRGARVIAEFANDDGGLRPGAFVRAQIDIGGEAVAVLAPRGAIQTMNGETIVFVREDDGFARRDVKIGRANETSVEIVAGLAAGEMIAVENSFLLKAELAKAGLAHDD